jgi:hypothetical protein
MKISQIVETRRFVAYWDNLSSMLNTIFQIMSRFKDNKKPLYIFSKCCSLLWKLCHQESVVKILKTKEYSEKLMAFEKLSKSTINKLSSTSSGTSLPTYSTFRGRSGSVPTAAKRPTKLALKKLAIRHGAAELSANIVRFHEEYQTAIATLNKEIRRGSLISE